MSSKEEMIVAQKALVFDVQEALKETNKETYTKQEVIDFISKIVKDKEKAP